MQESSDHRFQVDLRGLIDLLSQHLYSEPTVFVRELLQNSVDAIQARRRLDPTLAGSIQIEIVETDEQPPTLIFQDDGVGLTELEAHQFLATIGQSSKRGDFSRRPEDFLGQFGIGLLACFMVSEEIVVITRSASDEANSAVEWRGRSDGTYAGRRLEREAPIGTQVFLRAKPSAIELFEPERFERLARHYGGFLEPEISLSVGGGSITLNETPPWEADLSDPRTRDDILQWAIETFERQFLDVIPLHTDAGEVEGLAFVLAAPVHSNAQQAHRVYLKNMLLSQRATNLLPDWAFFVQCVVNARGLRPTASRESFYEDDALHAARDELGAGLRGYLMHMARREPRRLQELIGIHHLSLKALALEDDECLRLFIDWFPFQTSLGSMTFGEFRRENPVIRYVTTVEQFRQISQVAASESLAVINAGYVYDSDLLQRLPSVMDDIEVYPFQVDELSDRFEPLDMAERDQVAPFEQFADSVLQPYKCLVEVSRFRPVELPALFVTNENADFMRSVDGSKEVADSLWSGILDNISADAAATAYARLHLNFENPLIRRVAAITDREAQRRCIETLYVQSLLLGHFPLRSNEVKLLSAGLLGLINWALDASQGEGSNHG